MVNTNIKAGHPSLHGNESHYVLDCLRREWLTSGKYVERFEQLFADFVGVKHAVAVCNGTAALHLALAAPGL
jgi:perosamine synthetase